MTVRFVKCYGADIIQPHDMFRLTFVPANALVGSLLSRWPDACWGVFNAVAGGLSYPAQGTPTILDDAEAGKVCVFDVKPNNRGVGGSVQRMATAAHDAYPTTAIAQVEKISASVIVKTMAGDPDARGDVQTKTGTDVGSEIKQLHDWWRELGTIAKWGIAGLGIVAVILIVSKVPKVG